MGSANKKVKNVTNKSLGWMNVFQKGMEKQRRNEGVRGTTPEPNKTIPNDDSIRELANTPLRTSIGETPKQDTSTSNPAPVLPEFAGAKVTNVDAINLKRRRALLRMRQGLASTILAQQPLGMANLLTPSLQGSNLLGQ